MNKIVKIGMPLEEQRATIVAFTPKERGWLVLCLRWTEFMPYVVWDAAPAPEGEPFTLKKDRPKEIEFYNGSYCHTIGAAMYQYAHRGGDVSVVNE